LLVLPYDLKVIQPDPESISVINEFSKKTGDFAVLSLTDVKVLALTYQLEKQLKGTDHLKKEPTIAKTVYTQKPDESANRVHVAGFYNPETIQHPDEESDQIIQEEEDGSEESDKSDNDVDSINDEELIKKFGSIGFNNITNHEADDLLQKVSETESIDSENEEEDSAIEEDNEGWITPSNIQNVKKNFGADVLEDVEVEVACITTDFAMQNVLKQMGLSITSLDGRVIKNVRTFILRCYTCFKTTSNMMKVFCPKCGHKTLKRVSVSVNEKGEQIVHLNPRKQVI
jgi:RNA-binding protein NOB1